MRTVDVDRMNGALSQLRRWAVPSTFVSMTDASQTERRVVLSDDLDQAVGGLLAESESDGKTVVSVHVSTLSTHFDESWPALMRTDYEGRYVQMLALVPIEHVRRLRLGDDAVQIVLSEREADSRG